MNQLIQVKNDHYFCRMFENKKENLTPLSEMGEFKLIDHLTKQIVISHESTVKGIGDDAAVIGCDSSHKVITTDLLAEGVHFDLSYMPLKHLGYKAVMVNLSDVYAMNAMARQITVSIAVSNRFTVESLEALYDGILAAASRYKIDVIGGDTTASRSGLVISITAVGEVMPDDVVYRSGAKENDLLVVSGDLGGAFLGLKVLEREKEVFKVNPANQPDLTPYSYIVERQLKPEARKDIVELLKALEVKPTSMIDISDGLSSEILHIAKQSGLGCRLYEDKIPIDPQVLNVCDEFRLESTTVAINGGEDYELLFTIAQEDYPKIKANPNLTVIGHMTEAGSGCQLITRNGESVPLIARGWDSVKDDA